MTEIKRTKKKQSLRKFQTELRKMSTEKLEILDKKKLTEKILIKVGIWVLHITDKENAYFAQNPIFNTTAKINQC